MMLNALPNLWPEQWRISPWWPRDSRRLMRRSLLRLLAVAHDQRLDTATLVFNLADEHRGANRRLLKRLARRLESGLPTVAALEQTPEVLSDQQVLAIRFGSQSGTLGVIYRDLIREGEKPDSTAGRDLWHTGLYLTGMAVVVVAVSSFLVAFIYPQSVRIWRMLALREPAGAFGLASLGYLHVLLLASLGVLVLAFTVPLLWGSGAGRSLRRRLVDSRLRWIGELRVAGLLELLSRSVQAGRPLSGALSTLARYHFDQRVRNQLLFVRNEVEQGAEVWESLRDADLLSSVESQALAASSSPATCAWLMRRLATQKRDRVVSFVEAAARGLQVAVILLVAAVVLLLSCAAYQFLTHLTYHLG